MSTTSAPKIPSIHFANLDALRFIAAFSVFLFHFFREVNAYFPSLEGSTLFQGALVLFNKGWLGVNFFFVLSGFLITYLILHEKKHRGYFHYGKFLVRRTLRIWPLYYLVILIGFVIIPLLIEDFSTSHDAINYVFFLANFDELWHGIDDPNNFLTSSWSVAVEEQFYLFWGLILFALLRLKNFKMEWLIATLFLGAFTFSYLNVDTHKVIYFHTISVSQDLLVGCFIGLSLFRGRKWVNKIFELKRWQVLGIYLIGFAIVLAKNKIFVGDLFVFERLVMASFFGFIILDQVYGKHSFIKFGRFKMFNYLGKISYGLYMYHLIVMFFVAEWITNSEMGGYWLIFLFFGLSLIGTVVISAISYHLIESKFLNLKPK